ncbi:TolC family protein [Saccharicrinis sp. FJH54]|uniref:TolC family protein n=1 Tax=Saccharicrinis sp. FJH54 TaxID=3344665 RepID=UPI0035D51F7F
MNTLKMIKIKLFALTIVCSLVVRTTYAQQHISLDQAIDTAFNRHASLKSSELEVRIKQEQLAAEETSKLPDISSTVSLRRNLIIPSTPVPLGLITGDATSGELTYLKFGTDWQSGIGLNLNYDIFNPARKQQLIMSGHSGKMAELNYRADKGALRTAVTKAYAEAVLAREQLNYASQDTVLYAKDLAVAQDLSGQGRLNTQDVNESRLHLSQSLSRYQQALNVYRQSRLELAYQMGLNPGADILPEPADSLNKVLQMLKSGIASGLDPTVSVAYKKLQSRYMQDSLLLLNTKKMLLPTLSLNAAYGTNYYANSLDLFNTANWYGNSFVGLSLNIPISKEIRSAHDIEAGRLQLDQTGYDISDFINRKKANMQKAVSDMHTGQRDMKRKEQDILLARKNLEIARSVFAEGRSLPKDLLRVQHTYEGTRVDYLQAVYNYVIACLRLKDLMENK